MCKSCRQPSLWIIILHGNEATLRRTMRKWLTIAAASVAVLCVTTIAVAYLLAPRIRIAAKDQAQKYLQSYFQSSVEFSDFHVTLFPRIHLIVGGLVLRHRGRTDIP